MVTKEQNNSHESSKTARKLVYIWRKIERIPTQLPGATWRSSRNSNRMVLWDIRLLGIRAFS